MGENQLMTVALVLMGVSGSGKTTVATILAGRLGRPFQEGDELHPQSNIAKMKAGQPLTDADRRRWLIAIAEWADRRLDARETGVITCSALNPSHPEPTNRPGSGRGFGVRAGPKATV